jgi:hypothetical protein
MERQKKMLVSLQQQNQQQKMAAEKGNKLKEQNTFFRHKTFGITIRR